MKDIVTESHETAAKTTKMVVKAERVDVGHAA